MANVPDDSAVTSSAPAAEDQKEHQGFLQKIKDKLHIGHHPKSQEDEGVPSQATTDSAAVSSIPAPPAKAEPVVAKPVEAAAPAAAPSDVEAEEQHQPYDAQPTTDLNSLVGHEAEHHGGVPTFLVALPDQDIPDEVTKDTTTSDATPGHAGQFDSEEVFSKAQEGEHHHGVPTFIVALPDQEIPDEVNKEVAESETAVGATSDQVEQFDPEEVFSKAQEGDHHHGVPTFLVALPDQDIPDEVTKGVDATAADDQ